jgi:hypothetical protein
MARRAPTFFPQRVNLRVPGMAYTGGMEGSDIYTASFGAPVALNNTGILAATAITAAIDVTTFAAAYAPTDAIMGRWGRALRVVLSGAGTPAIVVFGRDYLGQRMSESFTGNGTTAVLGIKAFKYIDRITCGAVSAVTLDVGWRDVFGFPVKFKQLIAEMKNDVVAANAGTFVAGLANGTAATATNADTRGTYLPVTVIPNGTNTFEVRYVADTLNLHGNAQFTA